MKSNSTLKVPTTTFINNVFSQITSWFFGCILLITLLLSGVAVGQQKYQVSKNLSTNIVTKEKEKNIYEKKTSTVKQDLKQNVLSKVEKSQNEEEVIYGPVQDIASPFEAVKGKKEDISKRDISSKHFINNDGSYTALVGAGPIHYQNNGKWEDIDHTITTNNNSEYPYSNSTNLLESHFGATADLGIVNKTKEGIVKEFLNTKMYWEVNGQATGIISSNDVMLSVDSDKAYYNNIYGNISAEFIIETGKRKLNYIIPNAQALNGSPQNAEYLVFEESIVLPKGWSYKKDNQAILLTDSKDRIIYRYDNPFSVDASNSIEEEANTFFDTLLQDNNILIVKTKVKVSWLMDANRLFPIKVDPTVTIAVNNTAWWTGRQHYGITQTIQHTNNNLTVGRNSNFGGFPRYYDSYMQFSLAVIPTGVTVNSAVMHLNKTGGANANFGNVRLTDCFYTQPVAGTTDIIGTATTFLSPAIAGLNTTGAKNVTLNADGIAYIEGAIPGNINFALYGNGGGNAGNNIIFAPHNNANRPYLVIDYTIPCYAISATATDSVICEGENTTLNVTGTAGYTYEWFEDFDAFTLTGTSIGNGTSISVSPTETTQFAVLSDCGTYDFVAVAVVPAPTVMTTTPVEVNICDSDDIIHELSVTGGTIPNLILSETFNPDSSIPWLIEAQASTGNPYFASWFLYNSPTYGITSNDASDFVMVDSDLYSLLFGAADIESSLISPPFSLADYSGAIDLNFYHYYRAFGGQIGRVQISTDLGTSWSDLIVYTNVTQGANNNFAQVNVDLSGFGGQPVVMLRFNYTGNNDWYWAIDNVTVTGTPNPTTITWAPFTDLYTNAAATIPYTGQNLNTVYTMPTESITYTVTSESSYGCSVDTDIDVIGGVAVWNGAVWLNGSTPDIGKNVVLNGDYETDAITGSFSACNLIVNANLGINDGYLVEVENDVIVSGNVVVESRGALVQNDDAGTFTLTGVGTSSVNKLTALKQNWYDYTYWSSPVENETVAGAFPDTPANRRFWFNAQNYLDEDGDDIDDNNNDWTVAAGVDPLVPGLGYAATSVNIGPAFPRIDQHDFIGPFNTGDIPINVYTNALNTTNNWNFIGNPYPSAIDFEDFHFENSALIDGAAYLWSQWSPPLDSNPGNQVQNFNQNDYAIITVGSGGTAGASGETPLGYIPSGQGFFVHALNTGIVTFKNNARIPLENNNDQFFRAAQTNANRLWVNLTSDNGVFNQILVAYVDGATNGFDGYSYDAPRNLSTGNAASLVTFVENVTNQQFAIQGKDPNSLTIEEVIPLGFSTSITQPTIYKLSIADLEGEFLTNQTIYLKDNLLNLYHDLSASDYSFVSQTGTFNNRFEVVFQNQTLSDGGIDLQPNDLSIIELNNGQVKFIVGHNLTIESVEIFDMQGRILYNLSGSNGIEIYNLSHLSQAAYIAKVTLSNGQTITKRAVKRK